MNDLAKWGVISVGLGSILLLMDRRTAPAVSQFMGEIADAISKGSNASGSPECVPRICGDASCIIRDQCMYYQRGNHAENKGIIGKVDA